MTSGNRQLKTGSRQQATGNSNSARRGILLPAAYCLLPGFTLIELMVSVGILSIMIVIFSGILSQVQKVMTSSTDSILTDTNSTAACRLIRKDLSTISTKSGFLAIRDDGNRIALALVGNFESVIARDGGTAFSFTNSSLTDTNKTWTTDEWEAASVIVPGSVDTGTATGGGDDTLIDSTNPWINLNLSGATIRITSGTGTGQRRTISENNVTGDTLTVSSKWATNPDDTSGYAIYNQTHTVTGNDGDLLSVSPDWAINPSANANYEVFFSANAAMIDYGQLSNIHASAPNTLWRRIYLLKPEMTEQDDDDMISATLEDAVNATYDHDKDGGTPQVYYYIPPPEIIFPPQDAGDWWSFLVENCENISVKWHTRGEAWIDSDNYNHWHPNAGDSFPNPGSNWHVWNSSSTDWPDAIRVRFTLGGKEFEVFVAID